MVITSLIKNILPIAVVGLGLAFLYNVVARPSQASQSATALSSTLSSFGTGISDVGEGLGSAFASFGSGSAKLLDPLFTLKDLVYGETASIVQGEQNITASNTTIADPTPNSASDSEGVTPQTPASNTIPQNPPNANLRGGSYSGGFQAPRAASGAVIPFGGFRPADILSDARVATSSEKTLLQTLTGGLLG